MLLDKDANKALLHLQHDIGNNGALNLGLYFVYWVNSSLLGTKTIKIHSIMREDIKLDITF